MRTLLFAAVLAASFDPVWLTPAAATPGNMACSQREDVLYQLGTKYKEAPVETGLASNGGILELLTSDHATDEDSTNDDTPDTWTLLVTLPNGGPTCVLAAGENWSAVPEPGEPDGMTTPEPPAPSLGDPGMKL